MKTKKEMIDFLAGHFRYNTANGWNRASSYAANVKINRFVPNELIDKAYEMLELPETFDGINFQIKEFGRAHDWRWQVGFNGRSGGYLVLYSGEAKPSDYKSFCNRCGQRNFSTVKATGNRCGACGEPSRVDYEKAPLQISTSSKDIDGDADFSDWSFEALRARVKLVKEFDELVENCKAEFIEICKTCNVVEEEILVTKKVKRLEVTE
jgi:ribosomal protein L37E